MTAKQRATILMNNSPQCPSDLPEETQAAFRWIVDLLGRHAARADAIALTLLAQSWCNWKRATRDVHEQGHTVSSGGSAIVNPAVGVASQAQAQIVTLADKCGLTLAARQRLVMRGVDDSDDD